MSLYAAAQAALETAQGEADAAFHALETAPPGTPEWDTARETLFYADQAVDWAHWELAHYPPEPEGAML